MEAPPRGCSGEPSTSLSPGVTPRGPHYVCRLGPHVPPLAVVPPVWLRSRSLPTHSICVWASRIASWARGLRPRPPRQSSCPHMGMTYRLIYLMVQPFRAKTQAQFGYLFKHFQSIIWISGSFNMVQAGVHSKYRVNRPLSYGNHVWMG